MLKAISRSVLSFVFPISCELCGEVLPSGNDGGVCFSCESSIPLTAPAYSEHKDFHFDRVFAACYYEDKVKTLLCSFKFRRNRALRPTLLRLLKQRLEGQDTNRWDALAAVPMPMGKKLERGFNQAELLARGVAALLEKPYLKNVLTLTGAPQQQAKLSKARRRENVKRLFRASDRVAGKNIFLVDDILTTGETTSECARALKESGAKLVDILVVARGR